MLTLFVYARSALLKAHARQDADDPLLGRLRPLPWRKSKRVLKQLRQTDVGAVANLFADGFFPGVNNETRRLLGGRKRLEFRRLEPPRFARLVAMLRLGPKLVPNF